MSSNRSRRSNRAELARRKVQGLKDVKEGLVSALDMVNESTDNAIYDIVTEEEYRKIARDRLKEDTFVIDDDGTGYGAMLEDWENPEVAGSSEDEGKGSKGKGDQKRQLQNQSIKASFSRAEVKAARKPPAKPKPEPAPSSKDESDFMSDLLADLENDAPKERARPHASGAQFAHRKKPRLIPSLMQSRLVDEEELSVPARDQIDNHAMDIAFDMVTAPIFNDNDVLEPSKVGAPVKAEPGDYTSTPNVKLEEMRITDSNSPPFLSDPIEAPTTAVKPEEWNADDQGPKSSSKPAMEVRRVSTIKPKTNFSTINMPKFPSATTTATTPMPSTSSVAPNSVLEENGTLLFYFMDATEINGIVYLFGKVCVKDSHVSCAVSVSNVERNVYLLPRDRRLQNGRPTDIEVGPVDVYNEFDVIRRKHHIQRFASKPVERNYAFEVPDIPLTAQWLKVAYSFQEPTLPNDLKGGTFSHAFGTNTTALELFILKRKLMGPCWVSISEIEMTAPGFSWCKAEGKVTNPKSVQVLKQQPPPPPVSVMAISIKSALNTKNQQEVLVITTTMHSVSLAEDGKQVPLQRLVLVRPPSGHALPPISLPDVKTHPNERSLLNQFIANLQVQDPDILIGHDISGFTVDILLSRFKQLNNHGWSKLGRLRRNNFPKPHQHRSIVSGRLLLDTYLSAKEFVASSKSYSLNYLAESQLKESRPDFDVTQVHQQFNTPQQLHGLLKYSMEDCYLVVRLMYHLNCLSLYKQLANTCGNLWSRTMIGGRAERNEYLLLHEFHGKKYVVPDKQQFSKGMGKIEEMPIDDEEQQGEGAAATHGQSNRPGASKRKKPQYAGGLVLEPKKGFYDSFVLLLDFNSLYPSIIQEFNICFTTVERTGDDSLPPLPSDSTPGILPRLIKTLVDRRRQVKALMKSCTAAEYGQFNIRQLALKLTANSMYGCLGFTFSRFYCKPLAALITRQGRDILQNTVDLANGNNMNVIYGDTDSIMIHTGMNDLSEVKALGRKLKDLVNKRYRCLEIEMDGFFERMLLLKKKKYAALVVEEGRDGDHRRHIETKGLDVVRRDWCGLSHQVSEFVLNQLLMNNAPRDQIIQEIHEHLVNVAEQTRNHQVPVDLYVINKGLTKRPQEYTDQQPHVTVALALEARGIKVNVGDTVPYVICVLKDQEEKPGAGSIASRAYHPAEISRNPGLAVDIEWYLAQQVLPPVTRLCAVIEGTDISQLAHCLGLDYKQYQATNFGDSNANSNEVQPLESLMTDEERFANAERLALHCRQCPGAPFIMEKSYSTVERSEDSVVPRSMAVGWTCPTCSSPLPLPSVATQVVVATRAHILQYQNRRLICDDLSCQCQSRAVRVYGSRCWQSPQCKGRMGFTYTPNQLYRQISYFAHLFDVDALLRRKNLSEEERAFLMGSQDDFRVVHKELQKYLAVSDRNQVDLTTLFSFVRI